MDWPKIELDKITHLANAANGDPSLRQQLIANPTMVLQQYQITIPSGTKPWIEYHEGYGVFIALSESSDKIASSICESFQHGHHTDCLHF